MIVANQQRLFADLRGRQFSLYFNDDMRSLTNPNGTVNLVDELRATSIGTTITWLYRGFFIPDITSTTWQFRTTSDDASYLWVGSGATEEDDTLDTGIADVDNGGLHGSQTRTSGNISLTAGVPYPIAIVAGNNTGPGSITVEWRPNTSTSWVSYGRDFYFRNPKATNGYNL